MSDVVLHVKDKSVNKTQHNSPILLELFILVVKDRTWRNQQIITQYVSMLMIDAMENNKG